MKCPRCSTSILAQPDAQGLLTCPGCGSRLRTRTAAPQAAPAPAAPAPASARPAAPPPAPAPAKATPAPAKAAPVTLRPQPSPLAPPAPAPPVAAPMTPAALLEAILSEVRAVRASQHEMMRLLKSGAAAAAPADVPYMELGSDDLDDSPAPTRSRRRKTVLLIDDDPETLQDAVAALDRVEVPVRSTQDGNEALALIASEKPDVILLELEMQGEMAGRDVVNMIKATMEWVDIPLLLYTRAPLQSQKEARQIHGADDYVLKGPGSAETLVQRVIAIFRKA